VTAVATTFSTTLISRGKPLVAFVTLYATQQIAAFTNALCPNCGKVLCSFPGERLLTVSILMTWAQSGGRGLLLRCRNRKCSELCEVIDPRR
jgi:hypothetical protein